MNSLHLKLDQLKVGIGGIGGIGCMGTMFGIGGIGGIDGIGRIGPFDAPLINVTAFPC